MGFPTHCQKDMVFLVRMRGFREEHWTPDRQVVFEHWDECVRKRQVKDIFSTPFAPNFEFITTERDTPFALGVFMEVLSKLHFTDVPLAIGHIGPEAKHQRIPGLDRTLQSWMFFVAGVVV